MSNHNQEILNELESISPAVARIPRDPVLSVPEHYFETLPAHILLKVTDRYDSVPEGYFESLPDRIMDRIKKEQSAPVIRFRTSFVRYAVAAVLTGLLGLALFSAFNNREETDSVLYAEAGKILASGRFDETMRSLNEEEIERFLSGGGQDVYAALVAQAAYNQELPETFDYIVQENTLDEFLENLNIEPINN